jgi:hypothetical protein
MGQLSQEAGDYVATGTHYLENAGQFVSQKELRKASELLWGAVSQYVKALAATDGLLFTGHRQIRNYVRQSSIERHEPRLLRDFVLLEDLHRNFYDEKIAEDDFPVFLEATQSFIDYLTQLIRSASDRTPTLAQSTPDTPPKPS